MYFSCINICIRISAQHLLYFAARIRNPKALKMNTPDSKNTQNRPSFHPSFSCSLHYVRAFTGWPMLDNAGNSFENLTWCYELDCICISSRSWLISNKRFHLLIRHQWFGKDCILIFNPFYKCAGIKYRFFEQVSTERTI